MNGMGNNGNGRGLGDRIGSFLSFLDRARVDTTPVTVDEMNYHDLFKRSGGI
jgi:hypothetical protein